MFSRDVELFSRLDVEVDRLPGSGEIVDYGAKRLFERRGSQLISAISIRFRLVELSHRSRGPANTPVPLTNRMQFQRNALDPLDSVWNSLPLGLQRRRSPRDCIGSSGRRPRDVEILLSLRKQLSLIRGRFCHARSFSNEYSRLGFMPRVSSKLLNVSTPKRPSKLPNTSTSNPLNL